MRIQFSRIREQNVSFALVVVQDHVVLNNIQAQQTISQLRPYFSGIPVILLGANNLRTFGRDDIVRFLSNIDISQIPWEYADI